MCNYNSDFIYARLEIKYKLSFNYLHSIFGYLNLYKFMSFGVAIQKPNVNKKK